MCDKCDRYVKQKTEGPCSGIAREITREFTENLGSITGEDPDRIMPSEESYKGFLYAQAWDRYHDTRTFSERVQEFMDDYG